MSRNKTRQAFAIALLGVGVTAALAQPNGEAVSMLPKSIEQPGRFGDPLWVAASSAAPDGQLRRDLFSEGMLSELTFQRDLAESQGVDFLKATEVGACGVETVTTNSMHSDGLEALFARAEQVLEGIVVGVEPGFLYGHIATLVEVEVTNVRKGSQVARVLVPFRGGRVLVDGAWHCAWPAGRSAPPVVGGRILTFANGYLTTTPPVLDVRDSGLFFEVEDGTVSRPLGFHSWQALETEIERLEAGDAEVER